MSKHNKILLIILGIIAAILLLFSIGIWFIWHKLSLLMPWYSAANTPNNLEGGGLTQVVTPFGVIPYKDVEGEDLPCIGKYDDLKRAYYQKNENDDSIEITVAYVKRGDEYDNVRNYFTSKIKDCGYEETSHTAMSYAPTQTFKLEKGDTYEYEKDNDEYITLNIGKIIYDKGTYTIVQIDYIKYINENYEGSDYQTGEEETNPYDEAKETEVIGDEKAKELNNKLKQILTSVFGGAKLTNYNTFTIQDGKYYNYEYVVKEPVTSNHLSQIISMLSSEGYSIMSQNIGSDDYEIAMLDKEKQHTISMSGEINYQTITITVVKMSQ